MRVEVWSDIVCPWCYIGKRRFEAAQARFEGKVGFEILWRAFELDPGAPRKPEGSLEQRLASKYGISPEEARSMQAKVAGMAAREGLDFRFERATGGNTFDAHRLLKWSGEGPVRQALVERLFRAYFTAGEDISDPQVLSRLAAGAGLDGDGAARLLAGDDCAQAVRADEERARRLGIRGVPFFLFEGKYGLSGAQSAEAFVAAITRVEGLAAGEAAPSGKG